MPLDKPIPNTVLLATLPSEEILKQLFLNLHSQQKLSLSSLIDLYQQTVKEPFIPLFIFTKTPNPAQALVKYLKEKENYSHNDISLLLHKDPKTIWGISQRAKKLKFHQNKLHQQTPYQFPLSIFQESSRTISENIILYLNKTYHLQTKQIAKLLEKSPNTIAVLLKRAKA